jgi:hypothetical protein
MALSVGMPVMKPGRGEQHADVIEKNSTAAEARGKAFMLSRKALTGPSLMIHIEFSFKRRQGWQGEESQLPTAVQDTGDIQW